MVIPTMRSRTASTAFAGDWSKLVSHWLPFRLAVDDDRRRIRGLRCPFPAFWMQEKKPRPRRQAARPRSRDQRQGACFSMRPCARRPACRNARVRAHLSFAHDPLTIPFADRQGRAGRHCPRAHDDGQYRRMAGRARHLDACPSRRSGIAARISTAVRRKILGAHARDRSGRVACEGNLSRLHVALYAGPDFTWAVCRRCL